MKMEKYISKRNRLTLFFPLLLICLNTYSQSIDTAAIDRMIIADSLFNLKKYDEALPYYKEVEARDFFPRNELFQKISESFFCIGLKDSALKYMAKSIEYGKHYWTPSSLEDDKITLEILSYDKSGGYLLQLKKNTDLFLNSDKYAIYKEYSDSLFARKKLDQKYRIVGRASTKEEWNIQKRIDDDNRTFLNTIINLIGVWPGYREVGAKGESAAFLFVQHSEDSIFQSKCLILMKKAALLNNINPSHYGLLVDRYLLITKGYQMFGSQIEMIKNEEKLIAQPKKNNLLNRRYAETLRSYFSMSPLEHYLQVMTEMNNKKQ